MDQNNTSSTQNSDEKLRETAGKKQIFSTPLNYFDKLPNQVADRISKKSKRQSEIIFKPAVIFYTAVIALLMFSAAMFFAKDEHPDQKNHIASLEEIPDSILLLSINEELILEEYVNEETMIAADEETQLMYDYLIENNTDLNLISNEL